MYAYGYASVSYPYDYGQPYSAAAAYPGAVVYQPYTAYPTSYPVAMAPAPVMAPPPGYTGGYGGYADNRSSGVESPEHGQHKAPKKPDSLLTAEMVSRSMAEGFHGEMKAMFKQMKREAKQALKKAGTLDSEDSDLIDSEDEEFWQVDEEAKKKKRKDKDKRKHGKPKSRDHGSRHGSRHDEERHDADTAHPEPQRQPQQDNRQEAHPEPQRQKQDSEELAQLRLAKEVQIKEEMKKVFIQEMLRRQLRSGTFELTEGTVRPKEQGWSAEEDCKLLREHMKGLGTNEAGIIDMVATRSNAQRQALAKMFKTMYGEDLLDWFGGDLSGKLEQTVMALFREPAYLDAYCIAEAIYGAGTDEQELLEILLTRTNAQIEAIKQAYTDLLPSKRKDVYRSKNLKLEQDVIDDTSGHFKRLLVAACQANRAEASREQLEQAVEEMEVNGVKTGMFHVNQARLVDTAMAKREAEALYKAGEKRWGTDESEFNRVLSTKSFYDLRAIFDEYVKVSQRDILSTLDRELSGDVRDAMKAIVTCARYRPMFFAERLHKAIKGLGTDNRTLIRIIVSRAEIDLKQIKACYVQRFQGETLWLAIENDCSGDFKRILQAIVGRD